VIYVLAAFALVVPIVLVVQSIRGRVRMQCCAVDASRDARMIIDQANAPARDA
jgi:hypothetical protein